MEEDPGTTLQTRWLEDPYRPRPDRGVTTGETGVQIVFELYRREFGKGKAPAEVWARS